MWLQRCLHSSILGGDITILEREKATEVAVKHCVLLLECITKFDAKMLDDAEGLTFLMLMYSLLECGFI